MISATSPWGPRGCSALAALLLLACGTTTQQTRFNVAVTTEPADSTVELRQGDRVLASGPAPLVLDAERSTTTHRRGGFWVATVGGALVSVLGLSLAVTPARGAQDDDTNPASSLGVYVLAPGLVLLAAGIVGLIVTRDEPFTVSAKRSSISFSSQIVQPGEDRVEVHLQGVPAREK